MPSAGGGGAARQRHPCWPPVVHYPYQNWYFLPGPAGPGASVLKLPLVFVFVVFLLCGCRSWLCGFHPARCSQPRLFFVILLRLGKRRGKRVGRSGTASGCALEGCRWPLLVWGARPTSPGAEQGCCCGSSILPRSPVRFCVHVRPLLLRAGWMPLLYHPGCDCGEWLV